MPQAPTIEQRVAACQAPTDQPVIMRQQWRSLLFLHWPITPAEIQQRLPKGLHIDTYEGSAYLGVVPFYMHALRPKYCPPVPGISNFPELNLRTYVYDEAGNPGVWFFSLDAQSHISVWFARALFNLNYHYARMHYQRDAAGHILHSSARPDHPQQLFCYRPTGPAYTATADSLDHFLVERYRLFAQKKSGQLMRGRIHHRPYQIQSAQVSQHSTDLFKINGFNEPNQPPTHVCYSECADVSVYPMR